MKQRKTYRPALLLGLGLLALLSGCGPDQKKPAPPAAQRPEKTMKAIIQKQHHYPTLPSASGIERMGQHLYVVGDDSPFLYVLDLATRQLTDQIRLFASDDFGSGRIPKARKPDLECLTWLDMDGGKHLLALGSGSAPNRNQAYRIALPEGDQKTARVQAHALQELYGALQAAPGLLGGDALNLEAAATTADKLLLFQRATKTGPNLMLAFDKEAFAAYLKGSAKGLPAYEAISFRLPALAGSKARFSGATVYGQHLFISASVENTDDAIQDGEILGSFIGWTALAAIKPGAAALEMNTALIRDEKGAPYKGKVESLVVLPGARPQAWRALAITDNDQGQSDLLEIALAEEAGPAG